MSNQEESLGPSLAAAMPAQAAEFVQVCKTNGIALDFLPRTLPLVDRFLNGARGDAALKSKNTALITAYLGEVIRRETGASWYDFEDRPFLNIGDYATDPMTLVSDLLERGTAREGDVTIDSTKAYCELICRMQRLWLDGTLLGTYESMAALRTSMTPDAKLAGWLVGQSQLAVKTAKMAWEESLDFSDDSLDAMERILSKTHAATKKGPGEAPTEEEVTDASKMWGVYVGEVIRRFYGGQWSAVEGATQLKLSGHTTYPIDKVRKRIVDGPSDNVRFYFASIAKALNS
jgi:hypothetical protein